MTEISNKIVVETRGRTYLFPLSAIYSFNNAQLDVIAPNFKITFERSDIQNIYLLDTENASPIEYAVLQKLPQIGQKHQLKREETRNLSSEKKKEVPEKDKELELRSGMI